VWEIGILAAGSPLRCGPDSPGTNPILTAADVTDVGAEFVADPFMISKSGVWYLFFETLRKDTGAGEIGLATSADLVRWQYQQIVLREPFHLSYPYVFEWEGSYYMIPETLGAGEIRLYKSLDFPFEWQCVGSLVQGPHADPSIFRHGGDWWIFACDTPSTHRSLRLYHAPDLEGPWIEHCASPIVRDDARNARPAGRVITFDGQLIRFAQDCSVEYGARVWAFAISHLDREAYDESPASIEPVIGAGTSGRWRTIRMHHIDIQPDSTGGWVACVDGWPLRENNVG
jgi:hypothetical protein